MSVVVTSTTFTDPNFLFRDKTAANTWRENLTVPSATLTTEGVVLKAQTATFTYPTFSGTTNYTISLEGETAVEVASLDYAEHLDDKLNKVADKLDALLAALVDAGIVVEV